MTQIKTQDLADTVVTTAKLNCLTTKGDLLGYSTVHTRLPVGSNNQVLTADSTQASGMKWASPLGLAFVNSSIPAAISNKNTETAFASAWTIPANYLTTGQVFFLTAAGILSTVSAPTLTLRLKYGNTLLGATAAITITSGASNLGWRFEMGILVFSPTSLECQGRAEIPSTLRSFVISNTASINVTSNVDTALQLSAQWSVANNSNSITLRQFIITQ